MFGCAWKINFLEVIWSWPCKIRLWPQKCFEAQIFTSNHLGQRRRERERERERERKPKSRLWRRRRTPSSSSTIARTRSGRLHRTDRTAHYADHSTAPLDLASAQSRLRAISPSTHWSLSVILIFVVVVVVW